MAQINPYHLSARIFTGVIETGGGVFFLAGEAIAAKITDMITTAQLD